MPRALKDRPLDCLESLIRKSESKMNVITEGVKIQVCSAVGLGFRWLLRSCYLDLLCCVNGKTITTLMMSPMKILLVLTEYF